MVYSFIVYYWFIRIVATDKIVKFHLNVVHTQKMNVDKIIKDRERKENRTHKFVCMVFYIRIALTVYTIIK